ncbi:MAG TPA: riboflavin synthase [Bacteroidia bacterium]|jgi:riboflavin synthase|nr:riboflavin synthase [Bacteroidia bacterium]
MFTGIIEGAGIVTALVTDKGNLHIQVTCPFTSELKIDQSLAHNGVCLTVVNKKEKEYTVTAIAETLKRTNLGSLKVGDTLNLERCLKAGDRLDGHIVQGHVDQTAVCTTITDQQGSWLFRFEYDPEPGHITVEKGSVCVNGVSLTVVDSGNYFFTVAIIPYTYEHTNFRFFKKGSLVNVEFDILGKYAARLLGNYQRVPVRPA